uniref:Secreted protein n=1 Tax=Piliocolobus tephrosceles TaxID=591936 RepID=A0A8C9LNY0_9PRIM
MVPMAWGAQCTVLFVSPAVLSSPGYAQASRVFHGSGSGWLKCQPTCCPPNIPFYPWHPVAELNFYFLTFSFVINLYLGFSLSLCHLVSLISSVCQPTVRAIIGSGEDPSYFLSKILDCHMIQRCKEIPRECRSCLNPCVSCSQRIVSKQREKA